MIDLFGSTIPDFDFKLKSKSKYQIWKEQTRYRKSIIKGVSCASCDHHASGDYHDKIYHKCELLGYSHSTATDIRVSAVCDLWEKIK